MDNKLDSCGAAVIPRNHPDAGYSSWGQETVPALFRPFQSSPQIDIQAEPDELDLSDLDLDQAMIDTIH